MSSKFAIHTAVVVLLVVSAYLLELVTAESSMTETSGFPIVLSTSISAEGSIVTSTVAVTQPSSFTFSYISCYSATASTQSRLSSVNGIEVALPECTGSSAVQQTTTWQNEPKGRGTFSILISCLTTLILCIWTAVHPNLPGLRNRAWEAAIDAVYGRWVWVNKLKRLLSTRARYVLIGLLAPEILVYFAWFEWLKAKDLLRRVNQIILEVDSVLASEGYSADNRKENFQIEWTMTHSFFAIMGGFRVRYPGGTSLHDAVLTKAGLLHHLELSPKDFMISETAIKDRSKADSLTKFLVCLQALYIILQCGSRLGADLPITLLELNTIGHVLCAFSMYVFWFKKPLDVRDPIVFEAQWVAEHLDYWQVVLERSPAAVLTQDLGQLDSLESHISSGDITYLSEAGLLSLFQSRLRYKPENFDRIQVNRAPNMDDIESWVLADLILILETTDRDSFNLDGDQFNNILNCVDYLYITDNKERLSGSMESLQREMEVYFEEHMPRGIRFRPPPTVSRLVASLHNFEEGFYRSTTRLTAVVMDTSTLSRWSLVHKVAAFSSGFAIQGLQKELIETPFFESRASLLPRSKSNADDMNKYVPRAAITFATGLYGGLHAAAWHSYFPSRLEQICWRISAVTIASTGAMVALYIASMRLAPLLLPLLPNLRLFNFGATKGRKEIITTKSRGAPDLTGPHKVEFSAILDMPVGALNWIRSRSDKNVRSPPTSPIPLSINSRSSRSSTESLPTRLAEKIRLVGDFLNNGLDRIRMQVRRAPESSVSSTARPRDLLSSTRPHKRHPLVLFLFNLSDVPWYLIYLIRVGLNPSPRRFSTSFLPSIDESQNIHALDPIDARSEDIQQQTYEASGALPDTNLQYHQPQALLNPVTEHSDHGSQSSLPDGIQSRPDLMDCQWAPADSEAVISTDWSEEDSTRSRLAAAPQGVYPADLSGIPGDPDSVGVKVQGPRIFINDGHETTVVYHRNKLEEYTSPEQSHDRSSRNSGSSIPGNLASNDDSNLNGEANLDRQASLDEEAHPVDLDANFRSIGPNSAPSVAERIFPRSRPSHSSHEIVIIVLYGAARAYLVVEAFVSLRRLPVEIFQTPSWTNWIVHFGG